MDFWFEFLDIHINEKTTIFHDFHGFKWFTKEETKNEWSKQVYVNKNISTHISKMAYILLFWWSYNQSNDVKSIWAYRYA